MNGLVKTGRLSEMLGSESRIVSIGEIKSTYPDEWIALAIAETDADGFAARGEIITHDADERFVWSAIKLKEPDEPVYVFHTGVKTRRIA
jgi:hypothetical protein